MSDIDKLFSEKSAELTSSLNILIEGLLGQYAKLRESEQKGELEFIYLSFLRSSVLCKLPWIRIDLYDKKDRLDAVYCFADWDVSCVSDRLYNETEKAATEDRFIKDYDIEKMWLDNVDDYYEAFKCFLPEIIRGCESAQVLECNWHFGEFFGDTELVWSCEND